jgi:very-short-patch-repair endonuclease
MKGRGTKPAAKGARDRSWRLTRVMSEEGAKSDQVLSQIAARQHGVVSSKQLNAAGVDKDGTLRRLRAGRLHRLHRGVYAVGHSNLSFEGRCMAAVLACGEQAVISHRSAAVLWRLLSPAQGPIDVTLPGNAGRKKRPGITIHRSRTLAARITRRRFGIPATNPARTVRDIRRTLPQPVFRKALRRALDLRLIRSSGIAEADLSRSELERLFLSLCRRHHLPQPEVNVRVAEYEVDFLWRDRRLIAETDGFRYHGDRSAFERDRARDARLQALGYRVLRFTYRQLSDDRSAVVAALQDLLGQRSLAPNL